MTIQQRTFRNFVAKNSKNKAGAGFHRERRRVNASRNRQKNNLRKEMQDR